MVRKEHIKPIFIGLARDSTCKLLFKSDFKWFYRDIIYKHTNIDIYDYELYDNEISLGNLHNKNDMKLDILLRHRKKQEYLNLEFNNYNCLRRNEVFLHSLAVKLYNKTNKNKELVVRQINLNMINKNDKVFNHIALKDLDNKITSENFQIYNYNLYINDKLSYNYDKYYKLMNCTSYEEMENIVKGDEKFMALVDKLKELGEDDEIISIYTKSDDREMLLADARLDGERLGEARGEERGEARGRREGRTLGISDTARNMLKVGIPINQIQQCTGMSEAAIRSLM